MELRRESGVRQQAINHFLSFETSSPEIYLRGPWTNVAEPWPNDFLLGMSRAQGFLLYSPQVLRRNCGARNNVCRNLLKPYFLDNRAGCCLRQAGGV
jgi:hypothetical protein